MNEDTYDREDVIKYRLDQFVLGELGVAVATPDLDVWGTLPGDTRFGFLFPQIIDDQITVIYQPEILSLMTDTLDDDDFVVFMDSLEFMIALHVAYMFDTPDETERTARVESELHDTNPEVLGFLSAVQFRMVGGPL